MSFSYESSLRVKRSSLKVDPFISMRSLRGARDGIDLEKLLDPARQIFWYRRFFYCLEPRIVVALNLEPSSRTVLLVARSIILQFGN